MTLSGSNSIYLSLTNLCSDLCIESNGIEEIESVQDGTNWYIYCSNNPLNMVDPTGLLDLKSGVYMKSETFDSGDAFAGFLLRAVKTVGEAFMGKLPFFNIDVARGAADYFDTMHDMELPPLPEVPQIEDGDSSVSFTTIEILDNKNVNVTHTTIYNIAEKEAQVEPTELSYTYIFKEEIDGVEYYEVDGCTFPQDALEGEVEDMEFVEPLADDSDS